MEKLIIGLFIILLALLAGAFYIAHVEQRSWDEFSVNHDCKIVSKESASTAFSTSTDGNMTTVVIPGKTGWACNDGVTYFR